MENTNKFKYNPSQVRVAFKQKYCHEMVMPSGKMSGYELYPITAEEIENLTEPLPSEMFLTVRNNFFSESEWRLWVALRLKYGTNYMNPKRDRSIPDWCYGVPQNKPQFDTEQFKCDIQNIVSNAFDEITRNLSKAAEIWEKLNEQKVEKKYNFDLTSEEIIL